MFGEHSPFDTNGNDKSGARKLVPTVVASVCFVQNPSRSCVVVIACIVMQSPVPGIRHVTAGGYCHVTVGGCCHVVLSTCYTGPLNPHSRIRSGGDLLRFACRNNKAREGASEEGCLPSTLHRPDGICDMCAE